MTKRAPQSFKMIVCSLFRSAMLMGTAIAPSETTATKEAMNSGESLSRIATRSPARTSSAFNFPAVCDGQFAQFAVRDFALLEHECDVRVTLRREDFCKEVAVHGGVLRADYICLRLSA